MCADRTAVVICTALVAGCGASRPKLDNATLTGRRIDDVDIDGNNEFSDSKIIEGLAHRPSTGLIFRSYTYYDPLALRVDKRRVVSFYKERGYFGAAVTSVRVSRDGEDIDLRFRVKEGESTKIDAVKVEGVVGTLRGQLIQIAADAKVKRGERFSHPEYLDTKVLLRRAVQSRGYARAEVEGRVAVNRETRAATVTYTVTPGRLYRFGDVKVEGNRVVPASVVLERLDWKRDDLFDPAALDRTRARLLELRVFSGVRLDYTPAGDGSDLLNITVKISEGSRNLLKLGGGVLFDPTRLEARAIARYTRRGVLDPLTNLRSELKPGYVLLSTEAFDNAFTFEGYVGLERIDFLLPRVRLRATGTVEREVAEAYTTLGPGARLSVDRPFWRDRIRVNAGWVLRYLQLNPKDDTMISAALAGVSGAYRLGYYEQSVSLDMRDQPILPSRGFFLEARAEEGAAFAAGEFDYLRFIGEFRGYLPLSDRLVVAFRAAGGILSSKGSEPVTQRFYSGSTEHRGFGFRRLSPFAFDDSNGRVPLGGAGEVEASGELRFRIATLKSFPVRVVSFVDTGDVRESFDQIDLAQPHVAVGLGFRWDLPIGPLRVDLGRRVNRLGFMTGDAINPDPGAKWAFHFGLGEAF